jgi:hypothetical protein
MSVRQNPRIRLKIQLDVAAEIKVQLRKVNPHKKFKKSWMLTELKRLLASTSAAETESDLMATLLPKSAPRPRALNKTTGRAKPRLKTTLKANSKEAKVPEKWDKNPANREKVSRPDSNDHQGSQENQESPASLRKESSGNTVNQDNQENLASTKKVRSQDNVTQDSPVRMLMGKNLEINTQLEHQESHVKTTRAESKDLTASKEATIQTIEEVTEVVTSNQEAEEVMIVVVNIVKVNEVASAAVNQEVLTKVRETTMSSATLVQLAELLKNNRCTLRLHNDLRRLLPLF